MKKISLVAIILGLVFTACDKSEGLAGDNASNGKGGSMARFTIVGDNLYTVDQGTLNVFDLEDPKKPISIKKLPVGFNIETIFADLNTLYLGSDWGMYIYDITDPSNPIQLSLYQHIYSCDPVVANDSIAYVTLHTETFCGRNTNELQVVNIKDKTKPSFVSSLNMTKPLGLGIDGKNLFVCDNGLKIYSLSDPYHPAFKKHFKIPAIDVIPDDNLLLVLAEDGLHQYYYRNDTINYLSHIQ